MARIDVALNEDAAGWLAEVTVRNAATTVHQVRVTREERERYGGGDVAELVRRSFAFLLAREPNTSILREFSLSTIERYFPDYAAEIGRR